MKEPLILKTKEEPTVFNKEMAIGTLIAPGVGTVIGGYMGKKRMETEASDGKIVSEPSAMNKDTLLGGLVGSLVGSLAAFLIASAALVAGAPIAGMGIMIAGSGIGALAGAIIGGKSGKEKQAAEYQQALQQKEAKEASKQQYVVLENEQSTGKSYSADILAERLRTANTKKEL